MRVLYCTGNACHPDTFKRLLLFADEIAFLDRPSVTFGSWGTVGQATPMRGLVGVHGPVSITAHKPPSGPAEYAYQDYIRADLGNEAFRHAFLHGLRTDDSFASRFLQFDADYGGITGLAVREALLSDAALETRPVDPDAELVGGLHKVSDPQERSSTFRVLLTEASIKVTAAQIVAASTGLAPVSEEPALVRLLALRTSDAGYLEKNATIAPWLATAIVESAVPDVALRLSKVEDVLKYRERTQDAYRAFMGEVDRLAVQFGNMDVSRAGEEIPRIIAAEIEPRIREYREELAAARDTVFADVLKAVVKWEAPTVAIAFLSANSFHTALAAFLAGVRAAAPPIIDYVKAKRAAGRNAFAYLLGMKPMIRVDLKG